MMKTMIKAPHLRPGDTVGIVSPSWGGAGAFPHRTALGVKHLHSVGLTVKIGRHALNQSGAVSDTPENRASDIHDMFLDPQVKAIVSAIGGDHAYQLLPLLDFELIQKHPKIFMGYSDTSVLNIAIWKETGLVTFNGPALLTDFAEQPKMYPYTERYMFKTLSDPEPIGVIGPSPWWTEEFLDWETKMDLERPRETQPSNGWTWLKGGLAEGVLIGGCLESLEHLRNTRYWPDWEGAIFFFETSEGVPPPDTVDRYLSDYEKMGVLQKLHGMLVGRPYHYTDEANQELHDVILARTASYSFPIVTEMDFGHTAPQFTLPIGLQARIDSDGQRFEILEAAVQ
jgi:muramoyltetrapeptide carboxypeptidase LdcA involved in peptidoglycan recycling